MTHRRGNCAGFTLVEQLVATTIVAVIATVTCSLAISAQRANRVDSARVDLQQRARVAADTLSRALLDAGAGPGTGVAAGPLVRFLPPVLPYRLGRRLPDPAGSFRTDAFTVIATDSNIEPATVAVPVAPGSPVVELAAGCLLPSCGHAPGTQLLLFDTHGGFDLFTVTAVAGLVLSVRHNGAGSSTTYPVGAVATGATTRMVYLDAAARTLRTYDGDASDLPLLDDVEALDVAYYGERDAPVRPRASPGGENCLYDVAGTYRAALLPALPAISGSEAAIDSAVLTDGPWCGSGATQFDADLLRIRRVRVRLRLGASDAGARGADSRRFARAGHAVDSGSQVADYVVTVDAAPRNLVGRW